MIGSVFKRATRILRATKLQSNIVVGAFSSRAELTRNISSAVDPAAMVSVQETQVARRVVGKKFVIACDGESHVVSRFASDADSDRNLDGKELQVLTKQF